MTVYNDLPGLRWSTLKAGLQSPLHLKHAMEQPRQDTEALRRGRRVHVATLQQNRWFEFYGTGPDLSSVKTKDGKPAANPLATAEGKALMVEWLTANPGVELVSDADRDHAFKVAAAVANHREARSVLNHHPWREKVYAIAVDGTTIKCQADLAGPGKLADLKTIGRMLSERALQRQIIDYGYHGQLAWYRRVMRACGMYVDQCKMIFAESAAPHDVAVVDVSEEWLALGDELVDQALAAYAEVVAGRAVGRFPGVVALDVPAWMQTDEANGDDLGLDLEGVDND